MDLTYRPRRLRRTNSLRDMVRENSVFASDFIYPLFVHEGSDTQEILAMPGAFRWSMDGLVDEVKRAWNLGIRCVVLFPKVSDEELRLLEKLKSVRIYKPRFSVFDQART